MRTFIRTTEFPEARFFVSTVDIALIPKSDISGLPPTPASTTPRDHRMNMMLLPKNICVKPCCTTVCPYNYCRQSKTHPFARPGKFHGKKTGTGSSPRPTMRCKVPKGIPKGETAKRLVFTNKLVRFPLWPSGESENHTEGSRRIFAYFLSVEKVWHPLTMTKPLIKMRHASGGSLSCADKKVTKESA